MPLTRSNEKILITMMGVKFLMRDGKTEVACRAARELAETCFDAKQVAEKILRHTLNNVRTEVNP